MKSYKPVGPLHGPGQYINYLKVLKAQSKSMKLTWSTACGGVAGHVQFASAGKCSAEVEELNDLTANADTQSQEK